MRIYHLKVSVSPRLNAYISIASYEVQKETANFYHVKDHGNVIRYLKEECFLTKELALAKIDQLLETFTTYRSDPKIFEVEPGFTQPPTEIKLD